MEGTEGMGRKPIMEMGDVFLPLLGDRKLDMKHAVLLLCTCWVLYKFIFSSTWRRKSPLPPGPRPWPILGNLMHVGSDPHQGLTRLARIYGPFMYLRLGSIPTYVATSPKLAKEILQVHDKVCASRPSMICGDILGYGCQNFGFMPLGHQWRSLRKLFTTELVSKTRVDQPSSKAIRTEEINSMMKRMLKETQDYSDGKAGVVLFTHLFQTAANIVSRMAFGRPMFGALTTSKLDLQKFQDDIQEVARLFGVFNISDFIPSLKRFDLQGHEKEMKVANRELDKSLQLLLDDRKEEIRQGRRVDVEEDFLDLIFSRPLESTGAPMTNDQIKAFLIDILLAGTDTTAMTLEWVMTELLRNPKVMARAQQELQSVLGAEPRPLEESDYSKLHYLHAVMKEGLRMHPAGGLLVPHETVEDCVVDGYRIPAGARVIVNVSAIGRDPEAWDRALEFRPERFLDAEGKCKVDVIDMDFKLLPFGFGRRSCPGQALALRIVEETLAAFLHTCSWKLPRDDQGKPREELLDLAEKFGLGISKKVNLQLVPTLRLNQSY